MHQVICWSFLFVFFFFLSKEIVFRSLWTCLSIHTFLAWIGIAWLLLFTVTSRNGQSFCFSLFLSFFPVSPEFSKVYRVRRFQPLKLYSWAKSVSPPIHLQCDKILRRTEWILTGGKEAWSEKTLGHVKLLSACFTACNFLKMFRAVIRSSQLMHSKDVVNSDFFWSSPIQLF